MAGQFYVAIDATRQGKLKGESERPRHAHRMSAIAFDYDVGSLCDAATGQASGELGLEDISLTLLTIEIESRSGKTLATDTLSERP